jgi:hypothetical protein
MQTALQKWKRNLKERKEGLDLKIIKDKGRQIKLPVF